MTDSSAYPAPSGRAAGTDGPGAPTGTHGPTGGISAAADDTALAPRRRGKRWVMPTLFLVIGLVVGGTAGGVTGYTLHGTGGAPTSGQQGSAPGGTGTPPSHPGQQHRLRDEREQLVVLIG